MSEYSLNVHDAPEWMYDAQRNILVGIDKAWKIIEDSGGTLEDLKRLAIGAAQTKALRVKAKEVKSGRR